AMCEEACCTLLNGLHARDDVDAIVVAGGCGMNPVANGKLRRQTPYRKVYVQAAAGDAGGAIGAAFSVWHRSGRARRFVMDHAFWGPEFSSEEIASAVRALHNELQAANCTVELIGDADSI